MKPAVTAPVLLLLLTIAAPATADPTEGNEAEIRIQVDMKQEFASSACQARLELEWYQKGSSVHVTSELQNDDCAASSGTHIIRVSYRGDDGETQTIEFPEEWQRDDAAPVRTEKDYFIADNVDVLRVRPGTLRCECADGAAVSDAP